jgi:hypothetical protein
MILEGGSHIDESGTIVDGFDLDGALATRPVLDRFS